MYVIVYVAIFVKSGPSLVRVVVVVTTVFSVWGRNPSESMLSRKDIGSLNPDPSDSTASDVVTGDDSAL